MHVSSRRKRLFRSLCTFLFIAFININYVFAQEPPPGDEGGDPDIPIDGGISLLLAAGAAYGAKKIRDYRHDKNQE